MALAAQGILKAEEARRAPDPKNGVLTLKLDKVFNNAALTIHIASSEGKVVDNKIAGRLKTVRGDKETSSSEMFTGGSK